MRTLGFDQPLYLLPFDHLINRCTSCPSTIAARSLQKCSTGTAI